MEWDAVMGMQIESQDQGSATESEAVAQTELGAALSPQGRVKLD